MSAATARGHPALCVHPGTAGTTASVQPELSGNLKVKLISKHPFFLCVFIFHAWWGKKRELSRDM